MQQESRVPADAKVVVSPSRRLGLRERAKSAVSFVLLAAISVLGLVSTGSALWIGLAAVAVVAIGLEALMVRSQVSLGPSLAADDEHVWVRFGGVLQPKAVRLAWSEITDVSLLTWQGRRGAPANYLTFTLTDEARAELAEHPAAARHASRLTKVFGADFAISDNLKTVWLGEPFRAMETLAPESVKFTD